MNDYDPEKDMSEAVQKTYAEILTLALAEADRSYAVYQTQILNATSSGEQRANMLKAALGAYQTMKNAGEKDFIVHVEAGSGYSLERVARNAFNNFLQIASGCSRRNVPVHTLTEEEKFAICVASRVPLETERGNQLMLKTKTKFPCAIVLEPGLDGMPGNYRVFVKK